MWYVCVGERPSGVIARASSAVAPSKPVGEADKSPAVSGSEDTNCTKSFTSVGQEIKRPPYVCVCVCVSISVSV